MVLELKILQLDSKLGHGEQLSQGYSIQLTLRVYALSTTRNTLPNSILPVKALNLPRALMGL